MPQSFRDKYLDCIKNKSVIKIYCMHCKKGLLICKKYNCICHSEICRKERSK